MRRCVVHGAFALLIGLVGGCGGGGGSSSSSSTPSLPGSWRLVSVSYGGHTVTVGQSLVVDGETIQCPQMTATLGADGSYAAETRSTLATSQAGYYCERELGNWALNGNTLVIHVTRYGEDLNRNGQVDASEMYADDYGLTVTVQRLPGKRGTGSWAATIINGAAATLTTNRLSVATADMGTWLFERQ